MQVNTLSEQIKEFIVKRFPLAGKHETIKNDDLLMESGILDSLGVVELVTYLEQQFKIVVSDEDLVPENFQTIQHLANFLRRKTNSASE